MLRILPKALLMYQAAVHVADFQDVLPCLVHIRLDGYHIAERIGIGCTQVKTSGCAELRTRRYRAGTNFEATFMTIDGVLHQQPFFDRIVPIHRVAAVEIRQAGGCGQHSMLVARHRKNLGAGRQGKAMHLVLQTAQGRFAGIAALLLHLHPQTRPAGLSVATGEGEGSELLLGEAVAGAAIVEKQSIAGCFGGIGRVVMHLECIRQVVCCGIDDRGHGQESIPAHKQRHAAEGRAHVHGGPSIVGLIGPPIKPATRRQDHRAGCLSGRHHRRHQEVSAPQKLVVHLTVQWREAVQFKKERSHQRPTLLAVLPSQGVVIGQQAHAQLGKIAHDVLDVVGIEDGFGGYTYTMGSLYGLESPQLLPTGIQLIVLPTPRKTADVAVHIANTAHAHVNHGRDLRLQTGPAALNIARPREGAVALHAAVTRTNEVEQALVRVLLAVVGVQPFGPQQGVNVVDTSGWATQVLQVVGMTLRLAEVAPPSFNAL